LFRTTPARTTAKKWLSAPNWRRALAPNIDSVVSTVA
jgi:hypothetical protein